ncbi:MAG: FGLLP motif-containing membrane protein [Chloroflexota bacterium]
MPRPLSFVLPFVVFVLLLVAVPAVAAPSVDLWYDPVATSAPDVTDACPLLTTEEVEQATGMVVVGPPHHATVGTTTTCAFETEPYEVQLTVADAGSTTPDALDATFESPESEAERVPDLGQTAWWSFCSDCAYSTNFLMAISDERLLTISFAPTTDGAGKQSGQAQAAHRRWAEELAGLIIPRLSPVVVNPNADGLIRYAEDYGLDCADAAGRTSCRLEINDEQGLDATYTMTTSRDATGELNAIKAVVTSLDASMPSDAVGFLRGVAEASPLDDATALLAWFDDAVAGGPDARADDPWLAGYSDSVVGDGRALAFTLARQDAAPLPLSAPAAPTTAAVPFSDAVARPDQVSTDPIVILQSAALAALLVFLMPFPGQLFNSTLEAHEDEVRHWFRLDRLGSAAAGSARFWGSWPGVAVFTLLATLLYAFLDPGFGFDAASAPTFLGMLAGIVLVTAAFAVPGWLAQRRIGDRASLKVVPISLVIGIACVLLSRLTGFQPGYLYGLLIGLAFARELSKADEGRTTAIGATVMLVVALLFWVALGALPVTDNAGFWLTVLRTALAALMVAGLEGVVFGLLPLRFLPGEPLYVWNRIAWGLLLAVGAFAFFHILINPASGYLSDTSRTPLITVVALLVGFSLLSVAFWAWFRFRSAAPAEEGTAI